MHQVYKKMSAKSHLTLCQFLRFCLFASSAAMKILLVIRVATLAIPKNICSSAQYHKNVKLHQDTFLEQHNGSKHFYVPGSLHCLLQRRILLPQLNGVNWNPLLIMVALSHYTCCVDHRYQSFPTTFVSTIAVTRFADSFPRSSYSIKKEE